MALPRWRRGLWNHRHALVPTVHALAARSQRGGRGRDCILYCTYHIIASFSKRGREYAVLKTALQAPIVFDTLSLLCDVDELVEGIQPPEVIALQCPSVVTEPPPSVVTEPPP